jgi:biofilm protein TabA
MILESLTNWRFACPTHPGFPAAFEWLGKFDPETLNGEYEISGREVYAIVQRYETVPESEKEWEAHRIYTDIQYVAAGTEKMLHCPLEELESKTPYNPANDFETFSADRIRNLTTITISGGRFCIFFPHDAHKPSCSVSEPGQVLKVVIKVRVR